MHIVSIKDYLQYSRHKFYYTIEANGSENIDGQAASDVDYMTTEGMLLLLLIYADATQGWVVVNSGQRSDLVSHSGLYSSYSGGTDYNSIRTNYKVHTFTGPGTFAVSNAGNGSGSLAKLDYLVLAGGGGGGGGESGYLDWWRRRSWRI